MGCSSSTPQTCKRNGRGTEAFPKHLPRLQSRDKNRSVGLSQNLAWIQEKNFEERFEVVKVIGQGSIGEVSVVRRKSPNNSFRGRAAVKDTSSEFGDGEISGGSTSGGSISGGSASGTQQHRLYAMKSIHVNRLSKGMVEEFENEVDILQRLHHPNIIQLREVFYFKKKIYMCMTLCTGGQLNHRDFNEEQVCSVMSQTIRALVYMHETAKICHRDLKMENIMLESAEEPLVVKLIDFGLSKVFTEGDKMRTACGTVYTMAPEVLTGAGYTQKADLWSAGVIAFVLLCGNLPFLRDETDLNDKDKVEKLAQARFMFNDPAWKRISSGGKAFVRGLLKKLPGFRWTAREALDHCADVWGPSILRNDSVDLSKHSETGSQTNSTRLSESGSPMTPISPETPTHASRRRQRAVPGAIATSMRRFADYGEFKKAALMVTAFQLGKEEIKQLKDAFLEADTEGNGAISLEELRTLLREHGVDGAEVGRVFGAVDMDNSGRLHYMEFLAATVEARGYIEEENLKEAFERLDVDGTGFITRDNLRAVLGKTYDNTLIDKMLEEGDGSASGSIDWHDFLEMMKPVMAQEYRKEAEAMLSDTSAALKEAIEVEKRAVDQTPSFAGTSRQSSGAKESGSSNR